MLVQASLVRGYVQKMKEVLFLSDIAPARIFYALHIRFSKNLAEQFG